jgi:prophage regulatory protein
MQHIQILRLADLTRDFGIGRTAAYQKLDPQSPYYDKAFPAPIALGGRSIGWYRHELEAWAASRPRVTPDQRKERTAHAVEGRRKKKAA